MNMANKVSIDIEQEFESNSYGKFIILKELESKIVSGKRRRMFLIRFVETGYETEYTIDNIIRKSVKDPYYPIVCDVGYLGNVNLKDYEREYRLWVRMLSRCYNLKNPSYKHYGGIGVKVSKDWLCFSNFLEDFKTLDGYNHWINGDKCDLDKDLKQQNIPKNERIYSKNTCCILIREQNVYMASKDFHNKSTSNELVAANVYNYWSDIYNHKTKNNVDYISIDECTKYKIDMHSPKNMESKNTESR